MRITEIFESIQGESTFQGLPCVFIRLTGCNLRCRWCDTEYSFHGGETMTLDAVMDRVGELGGKLAEITGGEPLLQDKVYPLMERLLAKGYQVLLETSGEQPLDRVPPEVVKIVDVKCPDSGEPDCFRMENLALLTARDEVKFVIANRRDYEFARDFTRGQELGGRVNGIHFSPVHGEAELPRLAAWILEDRLEGVRFSYQLHKLIWGAEVRGV